MASAYTQIFLVLSRIHHIFYILHEIFFHPKIHNLPDKVRCIKKLRYKSKLVPVCINHAEPKMFHRLYIFIIPSMIFLRTRHNKRTFFQSFHQGGYHCFAAEYKFDLHLFTVEIGDRSFQLQNTYTVVYIFYFGQICTAAESP